MFGPWRLGPARQQPPFFAPTTGACNVCLWLPESTEQRSSTPCSVRRLRALVMLDGGCWRAAQTQPSFFAPTTGADSLLAAAAREQRDGITTTTPFLDSYLCSAFSTLLHQLWNSSTQLTTHDYVHCKSSPLNYRCQIVMVKSSKLFWSPPQPL